MLNILIKQTLQTELSAWFIPLCLVVGIVGAWILYSKKTAFSKRLNQILFCLRALILSLLCFLLLGPLLNQVSFQNEEPIAVVFVDNSSSISKDTLIDLPQTLEYIKNELESKGLEVRLKSFDGYVNDIEEINFDHKATNLSQGLNSIKQDFEQQNLAAIILVSDGIHNLGSSPQYLTLNDPVYTIGLGDSIPKKDLSIKQLNYNKVVYQGNRFPLIIDVFNNGFVGESIAVSVSKAGKVLETKTLVLTGDQQVNSFEFIIETEDLGVETYTASIANMPNESSLQNNRRRAFVETVDSEQKILIAGKAPHPDIKALNSLISEKEGTDVSIYLNGISKEEPEGPFDLVILHQLPDVEELAPWLANWVEKTNTWFITGTGDLSLTNALNGVVSYDNAGRSDNVIANLNPGFDLFTIDQALIRRAQNYPPIKGAFGLFTLEGDATIFLYQKLGIAETNRPLLSIKTNEERKVAVFSGSGFWKWRLQENGQYGAPDLFEEIFGKFVQFMATRDDKRNFRVNTIQTQYYENEGIEFNTEVYNQLFEKVYDYNIDLKLTDSEGNTEEYNYVNSPDENYEITGLASGIYQFVASTVIAGNREEVQGTFSVEKLALEDIDLTANFQLLRNISKNSDGQFYRPNQLNRFLQDIERLDPKPIARSSEKADPIVNSPWLLGLLVLLLSIEWFTRKYHGSY